MSSSSSSSSSSSAAGSFSPSSIKDILERRIFSDLHVDRGPRSMLIDKAGKPLLLFADEFHLWHSQSGEVHCASNSRRRPNKPAGAVNKTPSTPDEVNEARWWNYWKAQPGEELKCRQD